MQVIWKVLSAQALKYHGTLGHFCGLLGRLPKAKDPKKDFNTCRYIVFTVLQGHYIAAACKEMGIETPDSMPQNVFKNNNSQQVNNDSMFLPLLRLW